MKSDMSPTGRLVFPRPVATSMSVPSGQLRARLERADINHGYRDSGMNGEGARRRRMMQNRRRLNKAMTKSFRKAATTMQELARTGMLAKSAMELMAQAMREALPDDAKLIIEGIAKGTMTEDALDAYWDRVIQEYTDGNRGTVADSSDVGGG